MKREKLLSAIWGAVFGCLLSLSSVMCMVTAFDLQVNVAGLVVCCVVSALVCSACYTLPLKLLPVSVGAVISGFLWRSGSLEESLEALLNRLSRQYDKAYGWGIIRWGFRTADEMEPSILLMLCIFGVLIAMAVTWSVCRRKTVLPALLLSLICAGTCFVVTDTVPDIVWLYFLLLGVIVLLLTGRVRHQDQQQGNRLTLFVAPAVALALLILLAAVPQKTYHGQARAEKLVKMFVTDPIQLLMGQEGGGSGGNVDLTTVGFRNTTDTPIMEVTADFSDTLYLRSSAMNIYDGTSWSDSADYPGEVLNWEMLDWPELLWESGVVKITTRYAHRMLYTPYYLRKAYMKDASAGIVNKTGMTEYSFNCLQINPVLYDPSKPTDLPLWQYGENFIIYPTPQTQSTQWTGDMLEQFIRLPDNVRKWAEPLADEIAGDMDDIYQKAQAIAQYVRGSARYDTQTPRMSGRNKDFVRWFLEDSDTGYCVHFASATAVLLQAAGIPARYVTGYTAQVEAGKTTVVTADRAHAWVEYYRPNFGWMVLESTPAAEEQIPTQSQETTQPTEDAQKPTGDEETSPDKDQAKENQRKFGGVILKALAVIASLAALCAAVWGQYRLRIYLKKRRYEKCTPNQQAILGWQASVQFARLVGENPDKGLFEIAQKARFSQHTITRGELARFDVYAAAAKEKLQNRPLPYRFYYRIILAVY